MQFIRCRDWRERHGSREIVRPGIPARRRVRSFAARGCSEGIAGISSCSCALWVWAGKAGALAELDAVEQAYRQDGQFAILHNMTNCLRIGPGHPVTSADQAHVAATVAQVRQRRPDIDPELMTFIGELLVLDHPGEAEAEFAVRFAQVSSPVMAKGVEDTAFYRYQLLISLNEVGGDPGRFGAPVLIHRADLFSCRSGSALTMPVPHGPA